MCESEDFENRLIFNEVIISCTSGRGGANYVLQMCVSVCVSVCVIISCVQNISKSCKRILMNFLEKWGVAQSEIVD